MDLEGRDGLRDGQPQTSSVCSWQPLPWAAVRLSEPAHDHLHWGGALPGLGSSRYGNGDGRGYGDNMAPNTVSVHS